MGLLDWFRKPRTWSIDLRNDGVIVDGNTVCYQPVGEKATCYTPFPDCRDGEWSLNASDKPDHNRCTFVCND
jgi:hypothetical protein